MKGDKRPEDKVRQRLESVRAGLLIRFGEKGLRRILRVALVALVVVIALVAALLFIRIDEIEVTGDVTMFNESEVISAADISVGDGLFWRSSSRIKRNISKNMPIATDITVRKSLFGKVTIKIELSGVDYYCKVGDYYYALDEELRVLDKNASRTKYSAYGAVYILLPEVREPVLGETLVFFDTVEETDTEGETLYEVREPSFYEYTVDFLKTLKRSGYHSEADGVILLEKFEITLIYAQKFKVIFGDSRDLDVKFRILYEILAEGSMQYADRAIIDVSVTSRPSARPDITLDFSEFID